MSGDILLLANNLSFLDALYARYREDPDAIDASWRDLFANGDAHPEVARLIARSQQSQPQQVTGATSTWPLVNAYRVRGHTQARLDPLDLLERPPHTELEPAAYGFTEADLDREMPAGGLYGEGGMTLRQIVERCRQIYCDSIGLEFMHISMPDRKQWLAERMETRFERIPLDDETRSRMLRKLIRAEVLESYIHRKYPGTKRFSLEGSESLIPLCEQVLDEAGRQGAVEAVIGMAHRGRLAMLHEVLKKPARDLFSEFDDVEPEATLGGGDVKYHLGYSCDRFDHRGNKLHLSLAFNPSHLEAVDPVVVGRVRAKQRRHRDWDRSKVLGILLHGDAAFAGQGLVPETLNLSNLHGYRTGGTVHIIVNNQIGFTASPVESRSTPYCTDVAKMIQCPIFHVNGEDLDAVARVVRMAMDYRSQFRSDVVIDLYGYRKYGHNEMDEPGFTQPLMYEVIKKKKPIDDLYGTRLVEKGVLTAKEIEEMHETAHRQLDKDFEEARGAGKRPHVETLGGVWEGYLGGKDGDAPEVDTVVDRDTLTRVGEAMVGLPEGFHCHHNIKKLFDLRRQAASGKRPFDWAMGELWAFGTLLLDGINVRLTGQDTSRGTFSQRHAVVTDTATGEEYMLLSRLRKDDPGVQCRIYDSPLSEMGVLGFEYGYSLDYPDALVMWEAQFGDFGNGAQVIIDQFIAASEDKWKRLSGITLLLPHGYEGQGPEHSSARLERFLQMCAEDNWQITQPTTPAQYFHLLRRQGLRKWRKPLIVMTPKSLLRLPAARSTIEDLTSGGFRRVYQDPEPPALDAVQRVMLCTGKVYYELADERARREDAHTAIIRLEQLYPWPGELLMDAVGEYPNASELIWVQEEPENMGAWNFAAPALRRAFPRHSLRHCAREASASTATGSSKAHSIEQRALLDEAFGQ